MFDNETKADRVALITALKESGLPAYEYHSGGGAYHVTVDLLDEPDGDLLQIATGGEPSESEIGLMGWRSGESWESPEWKRVNDIDAAVSAFTEFWNDRSDLVRRFSGGEMED